MLIDWKEEWITGEARIDTDHRDMVQTINDIHQAVESGESRDSVLTILKFLVKLTYQHFSYEECLMIVTDYPDIDVHMDEHLNLHSIANILAYNIEVSNEAIMTDTINFFEDWFVEHLENMDAKLGDFLKGRNNTNC